MRVSAAVGKRRRPAAPATAAVALLAALLGAAAAQGQAQVPEAIREYRLHMFEPAVSVLANRTAELMFDTSRVEAGGEVWALPGESQPLDFSYEHDGRRRPAREFAERTYTDALLIIKHGRIMHEAYFNRATADTHFMSYSMGKSFNSILVGAALADGSISSVADPVTRYLPELNGTAYDGLTLENLLQMRTGVAWEDNFFVPGPSRDAHVSAFVNNEGRFVSAARDMRRTGPAGETFNYNSVEAALVGEIVSRATSRPVSVYLSERVWRPAGMQRHAFYVLDGPPGIGKEFTAGAFNAVLRDYGRVGLMMLNEGEANGRGILPASWVRESTTPGPGSARPGLGYAYLWWTIEGGAAYTMLGGEGQFLYVDPPSRTVVVKLSHVPVGPDGARANDETFAFLAAAAAWNPAGGRSQRAAE